MSPLSDFIKSRKQQKEQAENVEKEKRSKDWISWIPMIALVVGNLIVLAGELRVFDVVLTHKILALGWYCPAGYRLDVHPLV